MLQGGDGLKFACEREAVVNQAPGGQLCIGGIGRHQLERDIVRRVIYLHVNQIRYCYQQSLSRQPKLAGRLVVRFDITPQGKVQSLLVTESNLSVEMQSCVAETIRTWEFPESDSDENISVNYPFTFRLKTPDAFGGIQVSDAELEALGIFKDPEPPPVEILF